MKKLCNNFFNETLNNQNFIRIILRNDFDAYDFLNENDSFQIAKSTLQVIKGSDYANIIGDIQNQYSTNMKLEIYRHFDSNFVSHILNFCFNILKDAKVITRNKQKKKQ